MKQTIVEIWVKVAKAVCRRLILFVAFFAMMLLGRQELVEGNSL
nr:hypothetical protein [Petrachloros mirabilis]